MTINNVTYLPIFLTIDEGFWKDGIFIFHVIVPEEYNIKVCDEGNSNHECPKGPANQLSVDNWSTVH